MATSRFRLILACGFAVLGVALSWRALKPSAFRAPSPEVSHSEGVAVGPVYPLPRGFVDVFDHNQPDRQIDSVLERLDPEILTIASKARLNSSQHEALRASIGEMLMIYIGGSLEAYIEHLKRTGSENSLLQTDAEEREAQEQSWRIAGEGVANRPTSFSEAMLRPRFIDGREIAQRELGPRLIRRPPSGRYRVTELGGHDPMRSGLTIVEIVLPVHYRWPLEDPRAEGPVWFGVWLAADPNSAQWLPWRVVIYDCAGIGPDVAPMI